VALHAVHEEASAILADAWKLNPDIRIVIGSHHHLRAGDGRIHPLAAVVCVADWIASEVGAGIGNESDPAHAEVAAKELRFAKQNLDELATRAREILELTG
jgi:HD-like signal output (HDOD) protein